MKTLHREIIETTVQNVYKRSRSISKKDETGKHVATTTDDGWCVVIQGLALVYENEPRYHKGQSVRLIIETLEETT